ncbi:hypothetical protein RF11_12423 [Thelohanellus kitauei]|uniref:GST N-terminal domain-containing protein n=1 Tax=Thelohanellus kitauei TaxID=669202 RepID=A0A0C2MYB4_THEKT|nr:hypothetical protein RF11_12423 [Thelohanellus kitauei]
MYSLYRYENSLENEPIRLILNHAGLTYEDNIVNKDIVTNSSKINKYPCLFSPDGNVIYESNKICKFLAERHGYCCQEESSRSECDYLTEKALNALIELDKNGLIDNSGCVNTKILDFVKNMETCLPSDGIDFFFGPEITYADVFLFVLLKEIVDSGLTILSNKTKRFYKNFKTKIFDRIGAHLNVSAFTVDV